MRYMWLSIPHMRYFFEEWPMPRPELYPVKKVIGFDQAQLSEIEGGRRRQDPTPSVSEAIRRLVEAALANTAAVTPRPPSKGSKHKATELADRELDRVLSDHPVTGEERASRKRRLIAGPK